MRVLWLQSGTLADGIDALLAEVVALDDSSTPAIAVRQPRAQTFDWDTDLRREYPMERTDRRV